MKIALLHYSAPPVVGGVESILAHHARLMADAGHSVRIIAGRGEKIHPKIDFISIPLVDSSHPRILAAKKELDRGRIPDVFVDLQAEIQQQLLGHLADVDILIAHNVCSLHKNLPLTAALSRINAQLPSLRLVLWHHDLAWTTPRYAAEMHDGFPWSLLRNHWPGVKHVAVSEMRRQELASLLNLPAEMITVVPNGIDIATFYKLHPTTIQIVEELALLSHSPLLLLPVRITRRKNIELAIRITASLQNDFPAAGLIVTGPPGPHNPANSQYLHDLKELRDELDLKKAVHFLAEIVSGYIPDEIIADFYRLADALIFPSREEGFGIPLLEAGLAGLPVFCSDIPPLRALIGEYATYFSPDDDPGDVAAKIFRTLDSNQTFKARVFARQKYTWNEIYKQFIAPILEEAV